MACILILTLARVASALILFAESDLWIPFHATLTMISYWVNDLALFLYAFRIWIASSDADKRSKNLYIERFSNLTEREKLSALEPSTIDLPRARFMKYFYMTSQALVIVTFNVVALSTASIYHSFDHIEVDDMYNEHLQVLYWVDNNDLIWWFSISMLVYRTVIIIFLIVAIWNFLLVEVQMDSHSTEGLSKNNCAIAVHICLMVFWVIMGFLSTHFLWKITQDPDENYYDNLELVTVVFLEDLSLAINFWLILHVIDLYQHSMKV